MFPDLPRVVDELRTAGTARLLTCAHGCLVMGGLAPGGGTARGAFSFGASLPNMHSNRPAEPIRDGTEAYPIRLSTSGLAQPREAIARQRSAARSQAGLLFSLRCR